MQATYVVSSADSGKRIDQVLVEHLPGYSRARVQRLIESGCVTIGGVARKKRHLVDEGDCIEVRADDRLADPDRAPAAEEIPLTILYEDDDVVAIDKPAGLVVHPGSGNRSGTVVNALLYHVEDLAEGFGGDRPGIVHRLDKDTSGVLLAAKTGSAHASLAAQFADRTIVKYYVGVCVGPQPADHGTIEAPIGRSRSDPIRFVVGRHGKPSTTEYWLLAYRHGVAALRFRLHTGRTHQIRVHLAHIGLPIVGDSTYGGDRSALARLEPLDRSFAVNLFRGVSRQALHARSIAFVHPTSGRPMCIVAPLPADISAALTLLGVEAVDTEA